MATAKMNIKQNPKSKTQQTSSKIRTMKKVLNDTKKKIKKTSRRKIMRSKQTRLQIFQSISGMSGLSKSQVEKVFESLKELIYAHMGKCGSGEFTIPMTGIKILKKKRKASPSRKMFSPLTGKEETIEGKPQRFVISLKALKQLKESVAS